MKLMNFRKWLLPLLALLTVAAILSACTGSGDPADSGSDTPVGTASDTVPNDADSETVASESAESETVETQTDKPELETVYSAYADKVVGIQVADGGYDIYKRVEGNEYGYRYGCTYLYNDDGSVDAYFSCVGIVNDEMNEWDWISYRHSPDGGKTWEPERIVLTPTNGSQDSYSLCDPGVVYFGGYYYLAYTSTMNPDGMCNNIYVARSKNPDGPFEKWNGTGWGGYDPQPIFYYDESYTTFGIGEPSMLELNGVLYIYYTNISPSGSYTMVATADATAENWPSTIVDRGVATIKRSLTDSLDVKYVEEWGKFIAVAAGSRMDADSWLALYESNDGLHFELVDRARENTFAYMHNVGISSRPNGHINLTEDAERLCVIYAYGSGWGTWNSHLSPIALELSDENDMFDAQIKECLPNENLREELLPADRRHVTMLRTERDVYKYTADVKSFPIVLYQFDTYFEKSTVSSSDGVEFVVYDESVVTIDQFVATIKGVGTTAVEVRYKGAMQLFHITVTEKSANTNTRISMEPIHDVYTIYIGEKSVYMPQLRVALRYADGRYAESMVRKDSVALTFSGYDASIISVDEQGIVTALAVGETEVLVSYGGQTCTIKVKVSDNEKDAFLGLSEPVKGVYDHLDFSKPGAELLPSDTAYIYMEYDAELEALKLMATKKDPQLIIKFPAGYKADSYSKLEITYMAPTTNSSETVDMKLYYCLGSVQAPIDGRSYTSTVECDGEFHTLTIDLSDLVGWRGVINSIRLDYIDKAEVGDTMYIQSIKLS